MAPLTLEAMVVQALVRVSDITDTYPSTRGPMYRRLGVAQRKLFVRASQVNPDYYGRDVTTPLVVNAINLLALEDVPELIQRVEIANAGTSEFVSGTEVAMVTMTDPEGELAPRVTVRNGVLTGVGTDLDGVTSLKIWFARLPDAVRATEDGTTLLELDQPWDTLLEVDLAGWVVGKATSLGPDVRKAAIEMFAAEATDLMSEFEAHLRTLAPTVQRFMSPLARSGATL